MTEGKDKEKTRIQDYIVKLNDRNIQNEKISGFTLYGILGAMVFCLFYVFDNLGILKGMILDTNNFSLGIVVANIMFVISLLFLSYRSAITKGRHTKVYPYQDSLEIDLDDYPFFTCLGILSLSNFWNLNHSQNSFHTTYLLVFGVITGLNVLSPFAILFTRMIKRRNKRKKGFTIENIDFTWFSNKTRKVLSFYLTGYTILLSLLSVFIFFQIQFDLKEQIVAETAKMVFVLFGFCILIIMAMRKMWNQSFNQNLEEFEKEIFFEDLSGEEIINRFENEFHGIPLHKWIIRKKAEIETFFSEKVDGANKFDILIEKVFEINRENMPHEFQGRLNELTLEYDKEIKEVTDFVQKTQSHFKAIRNFSSINDEENKKFYQVSREFQENINVYNQRISIVTTVISNGHIVT
ncbi:MAG: hypothetical protein H6581_20495 [Bacteroidia bacterium]|nr:hypothetical protein [Bacteroidia bacterium]